MDIIYSRKGIKLPSLNKRPNNKYLGKVIYVILILVIVYFTVSNSIRIIIPIFEVQCINKMENISTLISNNQATNVMKNYKYKDIITTYRDSQGQVSMVTANIIPINEIISDIPVRIQEELNKEENSNFDIKLGNILGSRLLSDRGPAIPVKISHVGNIKTDLKSEFISRGINKTMHRIYLELKCNMQAITPYKIVKSEVINQVLLVENIIVGTTPDTYYNLEGLNTEDHLNIIE